MRISSAGTVGALSLSLLLGLGAAVPSTAGAVAPGKLTDAQERNYVMGRAVEQVAQSCRSEFPAMAGHLDAQLQKWIAGDTGASDLQRLVPAMPAADREALEAKAREGAERILAESSVEKNGREASCRTLIDEALEQRALPDVMTSMRLDRVVQRCRTEAPSTSARVEAERDRWVEGKPGLADARRDPKVIETWKWHADTGGDFLFDMSVAGFGIDAVCGDPIKHFAEEKHDGTKGKMAIASYEQALVQFRSEMLRAEVMAAPCSSLFPGIAAEIAASQAAWDLREAEFIAATRRFIADWRAKDPASFEEFEGPTRRMMLSFFEFAAAHDGDKLCREVFAAMKSGEWREKEPELYRYLANGRPAD